MVLFENYSEPGTYFKLSHDYCLVLPETIWKLQARVRFFRSRNLSPLQPLPTTYSPTFEIFSLGGGGRGKFGVYVWQKMLSSKFLEIDPWSIYVVYFDKGLGAARPKCKLKYAF